MLFTSNGGANSDDGGASGAGSPNNVGGANPNGAGGAIPSVDRGPSAPVQAQDDRPRRRW